MSENRIENALRYGGSLAQGAITGAYPSPQTTPAQLEQWRKDAEIREAESERRNLAIAIVGVAETLTVTHNLPISEAFDKATELARQAKFFVENWKMPDAVN